MRLIAQIHITVPESIVKRNPTLWEKLRRGLGGTVNLDTDRSENQLEASEIVDATRRALGKLGVSNALSLVIDDTVIFHDTDGRPDDLPDLVLALSEHTSLFGRGFRELRFAAEHEEAGLHLVIETRARTQHARQEPAAVVSVGGRLRALEPASGESADAYRTRVQPLTGDSGLFETARLSFESFVQRVESALRAALPDAVVELRKAENRLVKSAGRDLQAPEQPPREPMHQGYDPYAMYYPSPMGLMLDAMIFSSFMHMMMPPPIMVVSPLGMPIAPMDQIQAHPELASDQSILEHDRLAEAGLASSVGGEGDGLGDTGGDVADDHGGAHGAGDQGWYDSEGDARGGWDDGGGGFDDAGGGFDGGSDD